MAENPCPPPGKDYQASNGRNQYRIHVQITAEAWRQVPAQEQNLVINVLSATPVNVMPGLKGKATGSSVKATDGPSTRRPTNPFTTRISDKAMRARQILSLVHTKSARIRRALPELWGFLTHPSRRAPGGARKQSFFEPFHSGAGGAGGVDPLGIPIDQAPL